MVSRLIAVQEAVDAIVAVALAAHQQGESFEALAVLLAVVCHSGVGLYIEIGRLLDVYYLQRVATSNSSFVSNGVVDDSSEMIVLVLAAAYAVHRSLHFSGSSVGGEGNSRCLKPLIAAVTLQETSRHIYFLAAIAGLTVGTPVGIKFFSLSNVQKCLKLLHSLFSKPRMYSAKVAGLLFLLLLFLDGSNAVRNILQSCEEPLIQCIHIAIVNCSQTDFSAFQAVLSLLDCLKKHSESFGGIYTKIIQTEAFNSCLQKWIHGFGWECSRTCLFIMQHYQVQALCGKQLSSEIASVAFDVEFLKQVHLSSHSSFAFEVPRAVFLLLSHAFSKKAIALEQSSLDSAASFMQHCLASVESGSISGVEIVMFQAYLWLMFQAQELDDSSENSSLKWIVRNAKFNFLMKQALWRISDGFFAECTLSNVASLGADWAKVYARSHCAEVERTMKIEQHLGNLAAEIRQCIGVEANRKSLSVFVAELKDSLLAKDAKCKDLSTELALQKELTATKENDLSTLKTQTNELRQENTQLQQSKSQQETTIQQQKASLLECEQEKAKMKDQLEAYSQQNQSLEEQLARLKEQLETQKQDYTQTILQKEIENTELNQRNSHLRQYQEALERIHRAIGDDLGRFQADNFHLKLKVKE